MAGIVGMYCADGRPADVAEVKRMAATVKERGPDGITYWSSGPVAFGHLQFCTTPESVEERQPLLSSSGEACLVWNGRLDNREELLEALGARGENPVDRTDPSLVLSAYRLWGGDCVQRLIGDFAMAIWDTRLRQLWCARDYMGLRPFYYFWDGKTFLFGPEMRALLAHPLVSLKINEGMAGEYLASAITSREDTLYSDIRRLPSGSTLTVDATGGLRIASWWRPELSLLEYRTDEDYAEQFRHLMEQSVQSKIRCNVSWGVPLSGGLDSSTIAVTAQSLLDRDGRSRERVRTYSLACPGKPWDESEYISEIAEFAGLRTEFFPALRLGEEFFRQLAERSMEFPDYPNGGPMLVPMYDAAKRHDVRILLTGIGGNQWLDGWPLHFAELVARMARAGGVRQSLRIAKDESWMWADDEPWPVYFSRRFLSAAMPEGVRVRIKKRRFARDTILSAEFLRRTHLADRIYAPPRRAARHFCSRQQEAAFNNAVSGGDVHILEMNDREIAHAGLEWRHPFYDRRLVEFCLRLPREQRQQGNVWKCVLRNAMRGRLPEQVRTKTFQAEFSELYEAVLYDPWARARLNNSIICKHSDWLDSRRFAAWRDLPAQPESVPSRPYRPLWMVAGIDLWLENVLSSGGSV